MKLNDFVALVNPLIGEFLTDVAYHHFESPPTLPFGAYLEDDLDFFKSDDQTSYEASAIRFEVYTQTKDLTLENRIQELFKGLVWERETSQWLASENCYLTIYYIY